MHNQPVHEKSPHTIAKLQFEGAYLLDRTLVVIATEFRRPPEFDTGGGQGHQSHAFSAVAAGGGLKTRCAVGQTDEPAKTIVERPVSIPDFHATILCARDIISGKVPFAGFRRVPITDRGKPVGEIFI